MRYMCSIFMLIVLLSTNSWAAPSASRSSGAAPLAVHFTADAAASSAGVMPFHDYEYSWDFGDTSSGTWGTDGKSKNTDKGPVAAHVYETPGTYTATLTIKNSSGVVGSPTNFSITVTNPNTVFAGTLTTCVSSTTDFTGCPSGASQVTTTDLSTLGNYTDAGERVLLRRGSTWTSSAEVTFPNNAGPVIIGAFGTCSTPDAYGICSNAPVITSTGGSAFISFNRKQNWTIADITFTAGKTINAAISGGTGLVTNILISRIKTTGFANPLGMGHWRESDAEYVDTVAFVSCRVEDFKDYGLYMGSERLVAIGNKVENSDTTHVARAWHAYQGVINHNILAGSSLNGTITNWVENGSGTYNETTYPVLPRGAGVIGQNWTLTFTSATTFSVSGNTVGSVGTGNTSTNFAPTNSTTGTPYFTLYSAGWGGTWTTGNTVTFTTVISVGRHALKLHGPTPYGVPDGQSYVGTYAETGGLGLRQLSQFIVIADNIIGSSGPWPVSIGPQDAYKDERITDLVFEGNRIITQYGEQSSMPVQVSLMLEGRYMTARNNIVDGTGGSNGYTGIYVYRRGIEWTPLGNRVYNNTVYRGDAASNGAVGVQVHTDADDTIVRNNLVSYPLVISDTLLDDDSASATNSNNVLTNTAYFVDPDNSTPLSRDFSLTASSTAAIDQGYTTPLIDDYLGNCRTGEIYDVGAYEYGSSLLCGADITPVLLGGSVVGGFIVH